MTGARTVDLVYLDAGGGHRASALALRAAIARAGLPWTVRLLNLREVLDPTQKFRRMTGMEPEDYYNKRIARGWTAGLAQELKLLQAMIRWWHGPTVRLLQQHWLATEPDLVVSMIPNFNRGLRESLASALPGVPFATVLTDLADHPPRFWIDKGLDQHVVCGSAHALQQARDAGLPASHIHASSGMLLRDDFYAPPPADRAAERVRLGLDPHRPTGIVLFGGQGAKAMLGIAKRLPDTQLILVCGHNAALAKALEALPARAPRRVLGFTPEVARTMQLADFFIGKPGPGSLSEAVQMRLPVIVVRNRWTLPQERYNTQWVREHEVGLVLPSFARIDAAVAQLVRELPRYRAATGRLDNRAVFELPAILERIVAQADLPAPDFRTPGLSRR
ncbi:MULTISPECIES: glycosyltransferase [unclassified Variovorax]|uniref:glycosyltransferase n=1 Tax=unclassified Variovorax TaxID=663243 RepID=UPI002578CD71|nr:MULTISPECIES: glycosyltransferase [unclassified Variovorax]MDM0091468.1 glycosyltransferase [Variovorax sp. J22G40]MDM0149666.1 glycosyltransferase [Variovorax sp. J2P1-31]